jgi:hypothetical protein
VRTKKDSQQKIIQRQLIFKRYELVWTIAHKLLETLGNSDNKYTVEEMIGKITIEDVQTNVKSRQVIYFKAKVE